MAVLDTVKKWRESFVRVSANKRRHDVEFSYYAPGAKTVCLAGKFNGWNTRSLPMRKDKDGVWKIKIRLSPGRYEYKFFVDGRWVQELPCADMVLNPYGTYNCVIGVE